MEYRLSLGMHTMEIDASIHHTIYCENGAQWIIKCNGTHDIEVNLDIIVEPNAHATILCLDNSGQAVKGVHTYHVKRDASLTVAYCELMRNPVDWDVCVLLEEEGAQAQIRTATVAANRLNYAISCEHLAPHTVGVMQNYGIVLQGAKWDVVATGKINKGHRGSQSHQTTRVLTFDADQNVKVIPILLIDENDVQASHATSMGQPDENQLYYMMSRGLSRNQAIQVLAMGYLMPIADIIQDETLHQQIVTEIEEKVQSLCLM